MGWGHLAWAWEREDLDAREKWVLIALAYHAGDEDHGLTWPKLATLESDTGLSARTIERAMAGLEGRCLVYRWEGVRDGLPISNTYYLNHLGLVGDRWWGSVHATRYEAEKRRGGAWLHRKNIDRLGSGRKPRPVVVPSLFGEVHMRKMEEKRPSGRQRDTMG